jgi:hypothetical protein
VPRKSAACASPLPAAIVVANTSARGEVPVIDGSVGYGNATAPARWQIVPASHASMNEGGGGGGAVAVAACNAGWPLPQPIGDFPAPGTCDDDPVAAAWPAAAAAAGSPPPP